MFRQKMANAETIDEDEEFFKSNLNNNNSKKPRKVIKPAVLQIRIPDAKTDEKGLNFIIESVLDTKHTVTRRFNDFIWLHQSFVNSEKYAGNIIPSMPLKPNFEAAKRDVNRLNEIHAQTSKQQNSLAPLEETRTIKKTETSFGG